MLNYNNNNLITLYSTIVKMGNFVGQSREIIIYYALRNAVIINRVRVIPFVRRTYTTSVIDVLLLLLMIFLRLE